MNNKNKSKIDEFAQKFKEYTNSAIDNAANTCKNNDFKEVALNTFNSLFPDNVNNFNTTLNNVKTTINKEMYKIKDSFAFNDCVDTCIDGFKTKSTCGYIWDSKSKTIKVTFGKNGSGITDEFIEIGKFIKRLSKTAYVYIADVFVDSLDDVYTITLKYNYK